jgi:hypothetical protein
MLKNFAKNNTIPVLDYFRVKDDKISASDLETYLNIKNTTLKDGLYIINDNAVEYDSRMTLSSFDSFPNAAEEKSETQIKFIISSEVLLHYINIAIDYTGNDEIRPVMMGILFDYKDNEMFMVATDAHKLFKLNITQYIEINKGQKDFQFILSKANLLKFLENIDESPLTIRSSTSNVTFENANCKFQSRLVDGKYPNYNGVIAEYKTKHLEINIKDLFNCIKSKDVEDFIKSNKKADIIIYDRVGNKQNEADIYLAITEFDRVSSIASILKEIKICTVNYKLTDGNFQTKKNVIILMPIRIKNDVINNFGFTFKYFKVVLESLSCENVEIFYDEKNRAYNFGGDCFAYKNTIKAQKSISKPKEAPAKVVTKEVEPREFTESNEIEKAIETFEMLINLGGTKKELKEWNEAVETFKMLVGNDKMKNGGDLKIVESDNWQIKNANDRYYSVSMQSGNPVWNESPDLGYSYKKEDAENIKNKLIELGNKDLQLVKYDPNWWKMELGGNVLSNNEIIKNIDFSDNTDMKHGRYDFSFETKDNQGADMFDYDGYIIETPSSSRMNDEIEWGQNVPEDWEKAEKILIDAFYEWKSKKMAKGGGVGQTITKAKATKIWNWFKENDEMFTGVDSKQKFADFIADKYNLKPNLAYMIVNTMYAGGNDETVYIKVITEYPTFSNGGGVDEMEYRVSGYMADGGDINDLKY